MIAVLVDDLAFVAADAILRPADAALAPLTPAISRLDRQAGDRFTAQRRVQQPLGAGGAVVTGGGDLAAPFVVHVILQDEGTPSDRSTVERALLAAWQQADAWRLARVAAPPVGTGPGQLDLEDATELLVTTWLRAGGTDPARELRIVVEREEDRETVEAVIRRYQL